MPQESIFEMRGWGKVVEKEVRWRKWASAIGERQMFPRQTKRMETPLLGVEEVASARVVGGMAVVWKGLGTCGGWSIAIGNIERVVEDQG